VALPERRASFSSFVSSMPYLTCRNWIGDHTRSSPFRSGSFQNAELLERDNPVVEANFLRDLAILVAAASENLHAAGVEPACIRYPSNLISCGQSGPCRASLTSAASCGFTQVGGDACSLLIPNPVDRDRWSRHRALRRRAADIRPPWLRAIRRAATVAADPKSDESMLMGLGINCVEVGIEGIRS
jgi:hypothetical protein